MERGVIPARPTTYKGIKMRSRLEADYAAYLDRSSKVWGSTWRYEPVCFGSEDSQWLPDFSEEHGHGSRTYVELKPIGIFDELVSDSRTNEIDTFLRKMTVAWASEPDVSLELVFWEYQADSPAVTITATGGNTAPWLLYERRSRWPHGLLWSGMGQWQAVRAAAEAQATPRPAS